MVAAAMAAAAVVAAKSTPDAAVAAWLRVFAPAVLVCKDVSPDVTV